MENEQIITFTVSVLSPFGVPHYFKKYENVTFGEARRFRYLLETLDYGFHTDTSAKLFSIIINEPNLHAADIVLYNKEYFEVFGISELNKVIAQETGNPLFWEQFDATETTFVHHLLSNATSIALESTYFCSESVITRKTKEIYTLVEFKNKGLKIKSRKQFKAFAIEIGVLVPARCSHCKQIL